MTMTVLIGLAIMSVAGVARCPEAASDTLPETGRVRSTKPSISALIQEAVKQSNTFRHLVDAINQTDGIVYIVEGTCGHGVRACLVTVTKAGSKRMLWVKVEMRQADWDLIGSIGHELRHALEALADRTVVDGASLFMFYVRLGSGSEMRRSRFETIEAIEAGEAVRYEFRNYRSSRD
jgi:hypothetical protein